MIVLGCGLSAFVVCGEPDCPFLVGGYFKLKEWSFLRAVSLQQMVWSV
jgi:hypothetical protein